MGLHSAADYKDPEAVKVDGDTLSGDADAGEQGYLEQTACRMDVVNVQTSASGWTERSEFADLVVDLGGLSVVFEEWSGAADMVSSDEPGEEDGCRDAGAVGERDGAEVGTALGGIDVVGPGFESREEPDWESSLETDHAPDQVLSWSTDDTATVLEVRCQEIEGPQMNQDD